MGIKMLRKVRDHVDVFMPEDHNDQVDNFNVQVNINRSVLQKVEDPKLEELISKLESIVAKMRKVKSGDFYYAEDHNLFVEAWSMQKQINDTLYNDLVERVTRLEQKFENAILPLKVLEIDGAELVGGLRSMYVYKDLSTNPIYITDKTLFAILFSLKISVRAELLDRPSSKSEGLGIDMYLYDDVNTVNYRGNLTPYTFHDECVIYVEDLSIVEAMEKAPNQTIDKILNIGEKVFLPERIVDGSLPFNATNLELYLDHHAWGFGINYYLDSAEGKLVLMKIEW